MVKTIIKIYLSGKITGVPENNLPKFRAAADYVRFAHRPVFDYLSGMTTVRDFDCQVIVPHDLNHDHHDKSWKSYMKECLPALCRCDVMYLLDDWKKSRGALVEVFVAKVLGIPMIEVDTLDHFDISWTKLLAKILVKL